MFEENYNSKPLFPYAADYCMVLPKGMEINRKVGSGSLIIEKDYIIYFKPDTPEEIKKRFTKDYAKYHKDKILSKIYCD